jgi:two-component system torCAD operon response regulator TorR
MRRNTPFPTQQDWKEARMKKPCVLAVDDEPDILALISTALEAESFEVATAGSVAEFWSRNDTCDADVYVVDITLPDGTGFNIVKELRRTSNRGVIVLSGRGSETDHVVGLEIGADDYVTKPFRLRELAARVNAVYRRCSPNPEGVKAQSGDDQSGSAYSSSDPSIDFTFDDYKISLSARRLWGKDMVEIDLTTAEFNLLAALVEQRNKVLNRDQIMNAIKGRDWESYDRAVDGLVSRLRKKIPPPNGAPQYIRTVHGIGYSFIA